MKTMTLKQAIDHYNGLIAEMQKHINAVNEEFAALNSNEDLSVISIALDLEGDAMMLSRAAREFVEFNKSLTIEVHE